MADYLMKKLKKIHVVRLVTKVVSEQLVNGSLDEKGVVDGHHADLGLMSHIRAESKRKN